MSGVFGAGVGIGLTEAKLGNTDLPLFEVADVVVGSSAGAPPILYAATNQSLLGYSIYPQDLTDTRFIKPSRIWKVMDTGYLMDIFSEGTKRLEHERIHKSRPELYAVATHVKTGTQKLLNLKTPHILDILRATIHMPILAGAPPLVQGEPYVDGFSVPLKDVVEAFRPTDIVLVLNYPLDEFQQPKNTLFDGVIGWLMNVQLSSHVKRLFLSRDRALKLNLAYLQQLSDAGFVNVGVIAPEKNEVGRLGNDPKQLIKLGVSGAHYVLNLFAPEHIERVTSQMSLLTADTLKSVPSSKNTIRK